MFPALAVALAVLPAGKSFGQTNAGEVLPFTLGPRVLWTNSHLIGSAEPPLAYKVVRVFPKLKFNEPVDLLLATNLGRLFVAERTGKVFSFADDNAVSQPDLLLDLGKDVPGFTQLYGMTIDPGFATNRLLYLCYVLQDGLTNGTHLSRFKVSDQTPPRVDVKTEEILMTWLSGGHNGGCLKFGPDGYLYISTGDGRGPDPPDALDAGQDLTRPLSGILRVDVTRQESGRRYRIPPDNPFLNMAGAWPEKWAYGLRNPWKMSFDDETGELWVGDVGYETWEMIYRIARGGNYGWSIVEGPKPIKPNNPRGPTPILPPVISLPHTEAACIIGGYVYRGKKFEALQGSYIFGDWTTGRMWALRHDGRQLTWQSQLASTRMQLICFAEDAARELYIVDYGGGIHRLEPNTEADSSAAFPQTLSATGLFASAKENRLAPGVIPFAINAPMWSDGARAERFLAVPGDSQIVKSNDPTRLGWRFPTNTVLGKTLSAPRGEGTGWRRVETQILIYDGAAWRAYAYQWNDEENDATLVAETGGGRAYDVGGVGEGAAAGKKRARTWHTASRAECLRCHNPGTGPPLGVNAMQMDRDATYSGGMREGQLAALTQLGVLDKAIAEDSQAKLCDPFDAGRDLSARARSWLHVNCSPCHSSATGGAVPSVFNFTLTSSEMRAINFAPTQGDFGIGGAHVITAGDPLRSVLYYRISTLGPAHMPRAGSSEANGQGIELIYDWIAQMPGAAESPANGADNNTIKRCEERLRENNSGGNQTREIISQLLNSIPGALALSHLAGVEKVSSQTRAEIVAAARTCTNSLVRDLFERFVPEEQRAKRLGQTIVPGEILALEGDAARGRELFFSQSGANCGLCHQVNGRGRDFGPNLSQIGRKYSRAEILDNILNPSKSIAAGFTNCSVDTKSETSYTGLLVRETEAEVVLKDSNLNQIHIRRGDIVRLQASKISAMPEGLLQNLTAAQAADLVAFLGALRL